ncbi:MAG TPA: LysR family transcriptional regulator [Candidatus Pelethenecus faecipullorum]|uniref:LysR family transcriptional regulator n=1 Tax=Candidatus Pelethenecus faecipullorum TaxID=2840900 RepID=A0A9D1GSY2_9MOLU|nr:LysR family transcriptional regulator [Candidatus Pelethenecus faecipullorum]
MELRVLRYFIEVAREQNITAAAEKLYVTQSTLSKQLMDLEKELGKKLLVRGKRKTTLTEDGMFLFRRAQEIVDLADKTEFSLKGTNEAITGDISIGCGETEGIQIIIDAMKQLNEQHPDIRFHLYSGNDEDVSERLDNGLVDFGLFVGNTNLDKYDYLKLPINDVWGLLMRKDCPLAAASTVNPTDLTGIPLLCSRQALHSNELSGWLGYDFSRLHIISTHNLINNAAFMVKAGMGCALTIDKLVSPFDPVLTFRPLEPTMKADLIFAWKKYQIFSKAASKLLEILTQKIKRS